MRRGREESRMRRGREDRRVRGEGREESEEGRE